MGNEQEPGGAAPNEQEQPSFEVSAERLTTIVKQLESGELSLEQSLALFEEGIGVARSAQHRLEQAEQRVEELIGLNPQGEPRTRPFE